MLMAFGVEYIPLVNTFFWSEKSNTFNLENEVF